MGTVSRSSLGLNTGSKCLSNLVFRTRGIEFRITNQNIMCFEKLTIQTKANGGRKWNLLQDYDSRSWDPKEKGLV